MVQVLFKSAGITEAVQLTSMVPLDLSPMVGLALAAILETAARAGISY